MDFDILKRSYLFQGLFTSEIEKLIKEIPYTVHRYRRDETIFHPLEDADRVGLILKGCVQSFKLFPNGNQINVTTRNEGEIIGPAAVLSRQGKYPFGVVSQVECEVMMFSRKDFLRLLKSDFRLVENALKEISSVTYMLQTRLELISYHRIDQKIAFFLLSEAIQNNTYTVRIPHNMTKWAMMMNVSRPSLYREIKRLEKQGLIFFERKEIRINDFSALESILLE